MKDQQTLTNRSGRSSTFFSRFVAISLLMISSSLYAFSLDDVAEKAQALVKQDYVKPQSNLPAEFSQMQFADYMKIQPRAEQFHWKEQQTPFRLAFYHQGMHFKVPVKINEILPNGMTEINYDPENFSFGDLTFEKATTANLGYAGFRVLYPINKADKYDEIMSVLGASYFRVIGEDQVYGLSGRGMNIDTAVADDIAEEFPEFREFWIQRPQSGEENLVIYALLDSPSATGAYRFDLQPGTDTVLDVEAKVYLRKDVHELGLATLTSMFLYDGRQPPSQHNFRPQIHDSNGLAIHAGNGERIWRPLNNPDGVSVSTWQVENPKGFGLLQRGREFSRFQELDDLYHLRPSAWIETKSAWGKGRIKLIEYRTADETNDNIGTFWIPDNLPPLGEPLEMSYRIHWTLDEPSLADPNIAWVSQTLRSAGEDKQANLIRDLDETILLQVDFEGPVLTERGEHQVPATQISISEHAEILSSHLRYNPATKGWRLMMRTQIHDPNKVVEMRAALVDEHQQPLSETWSYQIPVGYAVTR
ncbi:MULTISPECIES: glucan biosynthesis protein G [unclassified Methylophaga]|uniref:glucan biosynthesis protein G n=2 Tax=Methylophaga TaxID=40222 RepID=UPI000C521824|nr:glucan biosynthesis protein G [Methylophaga sp.]MBP24134.1 glucan biosynthesis protein G [Methylophaga sp.]